MAEKSPNPLFDLSMRASINEPSVSIGMHEQVLRRFKDRPSRSSGVAGQNFDLENESIFFSVNCKFAISEFTCSVFVLRT